MEWLAAKDWNEGQSTPECFEYVQREREEKKDWNGKHKGKPKVPEGKERKDPPKKVKREWKWKGYS